MSEIAIEIKEQVYEIQFPRFVAGTTGGGGAVAWNDVTGKPATFPPSAHTHPISEVVGLQTLLNDANGTKLNQATVKLVRKASAGTITKGQVVHIVGSQGSHLTVELADADSEATAATTIGVAMGNITNTVEGYIIVQGFIDGLSNLPTATFTDGQALWLSSTTGGWTTTRPTQPAHGVFLGWVVSASNGASGRAYIKIINGQELDELHDVLITSPTDGQVLTYETSSGLWKNKTLTAGTVTSVNVSGGTTGLTTSGGPITGAGTVTLAGTLAVANGGTGATDGPGALSNLGAYPASNPSNFTSNTGTVTSVNASGGTTGLSFSGGPINGAGTVTLGGTLAVASGGTGATTLTGIVKGNGTGAFSAATAGTDFLAPFGSQTQSHVYAAPSGSAGSPSFRALVASDIPTLNQNTTGTASNVTGTVAVANGGTGATDAATARSNLTAQKTITSGTAAPTGGSDGDIYLQYV